MRTPHQNPSVGYSPPILAQFKVKLSPAALTDSRKYLPLSVAYFERNPQAFYDLKFGLIVVDLGQCCFLISFRARSADFGSMHFSYSHQAICTSLSLPVIRLIIQQHLDYGWRAKIDDRAQSFPCPEKQIFFRGANKNSEKLISFTSCYFHNIIQFLRLVFVRTDQV